MIRPAGDLDIPTVVSMGVVFMQTVEPYNLWPPRPEVLQRTAEMMLASNDYTILVDDHHGTLRGMIGMAFFSHPLTGEETANEMFWWVWPEYRGSVGIRLLHEGERWARRKGARSLHMVAPNDRVANLYERIGFSMTERSYHKRLVSADCNGYTSREPLAVLGDT